MYNGFLLKIFNIINCEKLIGISSKAYSTSKGSFWNDEKNLVDNNNLEVLSEKTNRLIEEIEEKMHIDSSRSNSKDSNKNSSTSTSSSANSSGGGAKFLNEDNNKSSSSSSSSSSKKKKIPEFHCLHLEDGNLDKCT